MRIGARIGAQTILFKWPKAAATLVAFVFLFNILSFAAYGEETMINGLREVVRGTKPNDISIDTAAVALPQAAENVLAASRLRESGVLESRKNGDGAEERFDDSRSILFSAVNSVALVNRFLKGIDWSGRDRVAKIELTHEERSYFLRIAEKFAQDWRENDVFLWHVSEKREICFSEMVMLFISVGGKLKDEIQAVTGGDYSGSPILPNLVWVLAEYIQVSEIIRKVSRSTYGANQSGGETNAMC